MGYTDIIFIFIANILFIWGVYATTRQGMIFEKIGQFAVKTAGEFYANPFTECPTCMSSIWGSITFWVFVSDYSGFMVISYWIIWCFALAGINHLIDHLVT